jgi:hypothetical protein
LVRQAKFRGQKIAGMKRKEGRKEGKKGKGGKVGMEEK